MNDIDVDQPVRVTPEPATASRSWPSPGTSSARPGPWSMVSGSLPTSAEPDDLPPFDPREPVVPAGEGFAQRAWRDPGQLRGGTSPGSVGR
jgi:hypothetical protein